MKISLNAKSVEIQQGDTAVTFCFGLQGDARAFAAALINGGFDQTVQQVGTRKLYDGSANRPVEQIQFES